MKKVTAVIIIFVVLFLFSSPNLYADSCGSKAGYHGVHAGCITNEDILRKAGFSDGNIKILAQTIAEISYRDHLPITCGVFGNGSANWYVEEATSDRIRFTTMCGGKPKKGFLAKIESIGGQRNLSLHEN